MRPELQREAAGALAVLLQQAARRDASPNAKILVNLKAFLRCDPDFTPRINLTEAGEESSTGDSGSGDSGGEGKAEATHSGPAKSNCVMKLPVDKYSGILTLYEQQREAEKVSPRRGRPPAVSDMGVDAALLMEDEITGLKNCFLIVVKINSKDLQTQNVLSTEQLLIFKISDRRSSTASNGRGATLALTSLTSHFGASLPERLPRLWEFISQPFLTVMDDQASLPARLPRLWEFISQPFLTVMDDQASLPARRPRLWEFISQPFLTVMDDQELENQEAEAAEELVSRLQVFEVVCAHVGDTLWTHIAHGVSSLAALTRHRAGQQEAEAAEELVELTKHRAGQQEAEAAEELVELTRHRAGQQEAEAAEELVELTRHRCVCVCVPTELDSKEAEAAEELVELTRHRAGQQEAEAAEELVELTRHRCVCTHRAGQQEAEAAEELVELTRHRFTAVRHMAARALAAFACRQPTQAMNVVVHELLPTLESVQSARARCGAAEALARVVEALKLRAVPYIVLLLVPLLGRMSDQCEPVRVMATRCFASLIQLMPLDGAVPEPDDLSLELQARRAHDKKFIEQLFNPKSIKDYKIPVAVSAELRGYQQAGVNWLRFLNEYKLHGVLCDDMGLGKTLQSIVVVAGSHYERARDYARSGAADRAPLPSLVVCPPTLTGHWVFEVNKFIPTKYLKPLQYVGPPFERERLRTQVKHYNLIVASYDIVRKDIDFFSSLKWNYCVLDEGHVIKNVKTKAFKAIKQIVANHRLILSGTPIQNNVVELWSLFEFLMPGLLGTERQFSAEYARPILAARDPRAPAKAVTLAARASQALHRQVLPFLLRRVKEDVLKELPPKITQDYYCELSPLQKQLYEDFSKAHMPNGMAQQTHVFQALHYLQNVCNHPKLVLTGAHPEARRVAQRLADQRSSLDDIEHSAKLPALKQLLLDCGIGAAPGGDTEVVVSQHRALIFCQLKKMLDIVENDLLKKHLPTVSYLRLDGSVPPANRHSIVTRFNNDPSIDLLLLTTAVGGLGLNLTGADTVIFVEHDWNPMKDAQAMDRAHRIGQRKVVNVYRPDHEGHARAEDHVPTKVQAANSEHRHQQRERGHGDDGHGTTPRPVPAVERRRGGGGGERGGRRPQPISARGAARPVGRQAVRRGIRHD
ncbi:unnamed protein product [Plutella xylostella]|uniref:(diamondback moth) hypothetical protein n=1 Tax=Plutella xylostella TaxID=51655 RepID=A0A8S4D9K0_PLUXY|nr:unnamed protein product [Plutella xylostella]